MTINWIKNAELTGTATISKNNIVLNKTFINHFEKVTSALIGVSEENNLIVKPLSLDDLQKPEYKDLLIVKVSPFTNYLRIGNSKFIQVIDSLLKKELTSKGLKYRTTWNEKEKHLCIHLDDIIE